MGDKQDDAERGFINGRDGGGGPGRFLGESETYYKNYREGGRVRQEHGRSDAYKAAPDIVGGIMSALNPFSGGGSSSAPAEQPSQDADHMSSSRPASGGSWSPYDSPDSLPSKLGDILSGTLQVLGVFIATQIVGIVLLHIATNLRAEAFGSHQGVGDMIGTLAMLLLAIVLFILGYVICIPTFIIAITLGALFGADVVNLVVP